MWRCNIFQDGENNPSPQIKMVFNIYTFRQNTPKYAKLMVQSYAFDYLNQIYQFFIKF